MKKRILLVLTVLTMLLCVPLIANAASVDDLTFDPTTGTITKCDTEAEGELVIPTEIDGVRVTGIGEYAFSDCGSLTSVNLPDGVTSIGRYAFIRCGSLNISVAENNLNYSDTDGVLFNKDKTEILVYAKDKIQTDYTIPDGVTNIGGYAFNGCESLNSITIPYGAANIGAYAFNGCESLKSIIIPDSVTNIGGYAFKDCASLESITLPVGIKSISY